MITKKQLVACIGVILLIVGCGVSVALVINWALTGDAFYTTLASSYAYGYTEGFEAYPIAIAATLILIGLGIAEKKGWLKEVRNDVSS